MSPRDLLKYIHPADLGFILIVGVYILLSWALCLYTGHGGQFMPLMYLGTAVQMTFTFLLIYMMYRLLRAAWIMVVIKPKALTAYLWNDLKAGPLHPDLYKRCVPIFIAFIFFFSTFTSMKFLIAEIKPFAWDEFLMNADRTIHFGLDPWRILQPILGYAMITKTISFFYILWLPVFFIVLYWQLFSRKNDRLRARFFYTFALTWVVNGTFLAIFFSSAGPCFYQHVTGSDHYQPLMDYLYSVHEYTKIYALPTQEALWDNYNVKKQMLGGGISAMPSVHIATVFLFILLGRATSKKSFIVYGTFALMIFIGSIHLGWHYAVDGYVAILTTYILWRISGLITDKIYEAKV